MLKYGIREQEAALLKAACEGLPEHLLQRLDACNTSHRFMAYRGKQLVIYKWSDGRPVIHKTLTLKQSDFNLVDGFSSIWDDPLDGYYSISHTPTEVAPNIFLWHTYISDVQYRRSNGEFGGRVSFLYACPHHPSLKDKGCYFIQEKPIFDAGVNL